MGERERGSRIRERVKEMRQDVKTERTEKTSEGLICSLICGCFSLPSFVWFCGGFFVYILACRAFLYA